MTVEIIRQNGHRIWGKTVAMGIYPTLGGIAFTVLFFGTVLGHDELRRQR